MAAGQQGSVVTFIQPRGYFYLERDKLSFDGSTAPNGVPANGAGVSAGKLVLKDGGVRTISAEFNGKKLAGRSWPAAQNHLVLLEVAPQEKPGATRAEHASGCCKQQDAGGGEGYGKKNKSIAIRGKSQARVHALPVFKRDISVIGCNGDD